MRGYLVVLLVICGYTAFAQGCSDAGFCTMGAMKPGESIKVGPDSPYSYTEPVVAYEQTGVKGKRYVAYQTGRVELVDEARFQQLVKP